MKSTIKLQLREFPVTIRDERTGLQTEDTLILTKDNLTAAAAVNMDCKELIWRIYNRKGYHVINIGRPAKREAVIDLAELPTTEERGAGADE